MIEEEKNQIENHDKNLKEKGDGDFGMDEKNAEFQENDIYSKNNKKDFVSSRAMLVVLIILAGGILIFGFSSLYKNIYTKVDYGSVADKNQTVEEDNVVEDLLELQNQDTDKDGLSDYEEQYVYKTSPYLPDTDSDGYMDKEEIDGGYDPLCPKGEDCYGTGAEISESSSETAIQTEFDSTEEIPPEVMDQLNNLSADEVRALLLETGQMTQEQLDQIDDETLMGIFREVLNQ